MEIDVDLHLQTNATLIRLERIMSKLSDDVAALKTAVDANTVAVTNAAGNAAEVAAAEAVIEAETAQVEANTAALSPAVPVAPTV